MLDEFGFLVQNLEDYVSNRTEKIRSELTKMLPEDVTLKLRSEYKCLMDMQRVLEESIKKAKRLEFDDD